MNSQRDEKLFLDSLKKETTNVTDRRYGCYERSDSFGLASDVKSRVISIFSVGILVLDEAIIAKIDKKIIKFIYTQNFDNINQFILIFPQYYLHEIYTFVQIIV